MKSSLNIPPQFQAFAQQFQTRWPAYRQLMRLDRPIGTLLLLWPTYWALWLAADGLPSLKNFIIFTLGVFLMRAAGCVINDYADRNFDGHVKRTRERPLATGKVSEKEALLLFAVLVGCSFILVLFTNLLTIYLSVGGLLLAAIYPFMKRYTHLPQVVLGAAFGWGIPMAYAAEAGKLTEIAWLLFTANLVWTVAYDTMYAMVDRDDDLKIGVKSTAILFGDADRLIIGCLQALALIILALIGHRVGMGQLYFAGIGAMLLLFIYQQHLIRDRQRDACFKAFLNNNWAGLSVYIGILLHYVL